MSHTFQDGASRRPAKDGGLHRAERIIGALRPAGTPSPPAALMGAVAPRRIVPRKRTEAEEGGSMGRVSISELRDDSPADPWSRAYTHLADNISASLPLSGEAIFAVLTPGGTPPYATIMLTGAAVADKLSSDVLLIDGNYDDSNLAGRIGIQAQSGLGDVLAGTADWTQSLVKTRVDRLWLMPASPFRHKGRVSDERWVRAFLNALRNRFRLILFAAGTPTHKGVAPFLPYCTGAYLVVRLGITTDRLAKQTVRRTEKYGCRILGCVVTHD